ncbi:MAG TPA: MGMT family protein [Mycobacteriales bacterium]|nr:MGMT family protein [Mycobacteriales bacterium]
MSPVSVLRGLVLEPSPGFVDRTLTAVGLVDDYAVLDGPAGRWHVSWGPRGVSLVVATEDPAEFARVHAGRVGRPLRAAAGLPVALERALRTQRVPKGLRVELSRLSSFEQAVLAKAREIPRGEIRPYAWVAREIGRPAAVRAVGTALGRNPVPVLIPCHRVVRADGRIGEYVFGSAAKRALLQHEGVDTEELARLAATGVRYLGSDTTAVFCLPSCRDARRIGAAHRVAFRDERAARAARYRPCRHCRPVADSAPPRLTG